MNIAQQRLRNQRLTGEPFEKLEDAVRFLTAVQSQDYPGAKWALAQRVKGVTDSDIDDLFNMGRMLRTHVMRPTWHFVMPSDIRWMLKLTAPRVNAVSAYVYRMLELDAAVFRRSNAAISRALRGGNHLTRDELGRTLGRAGIEANRLRLAYLMFRAELDALICSGPLRGKQFTYALLDERAPECETLDRDEALAELTKRYFTGHGPALLQDYAWWSGLTMADAKAGIEMVRGHLNHATVKGKTYWFGSSATIRKAKKPVIHLLPNYDEYLIAYKDRSSSFDPSKARLLPRKDNVFASHLLALNGQLIGGWRRTIEKGAVSVKVTLLVRLSKPEKAALRAAVDGYGRFLNKSVARLEITG